MSKAIKFTIMGHVALKSNDAAALQEAANAVLEVQKKLEEITSAKVTSVKTAFGAIKE